MALITQIRHRMGWAVGAVAIGLLLFIVGGDLLSANSKLLGRDQQVLAKISGKKVEIDDFNRKLDELKTNYYVQTGKLPAETELVGLREQAWNDLLFDITYKDEFDALGIEVTEEEEWDMIQGKNIHPAVRQSFTNPQTGQFDRAMVVNYLQNMQKLEPKQQYLWQLFEKGISKERLRNKYDNLFRLSAFATTQEARRLYKSQNDKAEAKFVFIPYATIDDKEINVSDADIQEYINKNKARFDQEESVNLSYVTFPIVPTAKDSAFYFQDLLSLKADFIASEKDSTFVVRNSDQAEPPISVTMSELPIVLKDNKNLQKDSVYGPYLELNSYTLYKVSNIFNDSVASIRASHILFKPKSESPEDKAEALAEAKRVLGLIKGGERFEMMAMQYGTDGTKNSGGDLGWFSANRMVKKFSDAVFKVGKPGLLPEPVETEFGYHLIKITEPKTNRKYEVAKVTRLITPGEETRSEAYNIASAFSAANRTSADFDKTLEKDKTIFKYTAFKVLKNASNVNSLSDAKELVRWAFLDAKAGQVSDVLEINDQFVVASLNRKSEKGIAKPEDVRDEVFGVVRNELKAKKITEKLESIGDLKIEDIAAKYGPAAVLNVGNDLNISAASLPGAGYEPEVIGAAFGIAKGKKSKPITGTNGVYIIENINTVAAPEVGDYNMYRNQLIQSYASRAGYSLGDVLKQAAEI
ncbi:MAG: SurA N-terminal domain-containing protein, partial [Cytophagales bacterium]|nr:SurA N-terminal domain-containing protein [Cytophagales bacterium]